MACEAMREGESDVCEDIDGMSYVSLKFKTFLESVHEKLVLAHSDIVDIRLSVKYHCRLCVAFCLNLLKTAELDEYGSCAVLKHNTIVSLV